MRASLPYLLVMMSTKQVRKEVGSFVGTNSCTPSAEHPIHYDGSAETCSILLMLSPFGHSAGLLWANGVTPHVSKGLKLARLYFKESKIITSSKVLSSSMAGLLLHGHKKQDGKYLPR